MKTKFNSRLFAIIANLLLLLFVGCERIKTGIIYDKEYRPERRWHTTETHRHVNPTTHRVTYTTDVTYHVKMEEYVLWIRGDDSKGRVQTRAVLVDRQSYADARPGDVYDHGTITKSPTAIESNVPNR